MSGYTQVLRDRFSEIVKGDARTDAQSRTRKEGIRSGPEVNLDLCFFIADTTSVSVI